MQIRIGSALCFAMQPSGLYFSATASSLFLISIFGRLCVSLPQELGSLSVL